MKTLEPGNFIFDTGVVKSPHRGSKMTMVAAGQRQAHSNIKTRPTYRNYANDFISAKTPQAQSFQYRGNGLVQQNPIQVSQKRKTVRKESGSKLEQLFSLGKNPANVPKINSHGYFSSRSNKVVKSADFGQAFGLQ